MKDSKTGKQEVSLSGMIRAIEWDIDDNVTAIEISTENEDYEVEFSGMGKNLFDCIGEEVEVVGTISTVKGKNDRIKVIKYKVMEYGIDDELEDYDYDYDYDNNYDNDTDYDEYDYH